MVLKSSLITAETWYQVKFLAFSVDQNSIANRIFGYKPSKTAFKGGKLFIGTLIDVMQTVSVAEIEL